MRGVVLVVSVVCMLAIWTSCGAAPKAGGNLRGGDNSQISQTNEQRTYFGLSHEQLVLVLAGLVAVGSFCIALFLAPGPAIAYPGLATGLMILFLVLTVAGPLLICWMLL